MPIKTIFLDRDGVINKDINYLFRIEDFEFIDGIFEACIHFQELGYDIIIITNQSGIARGYFTEKDYHSMTQWMLDKFKKNGIYILDNFYCPHGPESICSCRKPRPGMFIEAQNKHKVDMKRSWMIGDTERDISAASLAGIRNTILLTNIQKTSDLNSKAKFIINSLEKTKKIIMS